MLEAPGIEPWALTHAALPAVAPAHDRDGIDLYFCSRDARSRARIGRAPLEVDGGRLVAGAVDPDPVVGVGALGAFDDSGVTTSWIVADGERRYLYYTGWSLGRSVPFYFYVGLAVSEDGGRTFERVSQAPVLERDAGDPFLTASPCILVEDGLWRMWYVSAERWEERDGEPMHWYRVKYAESRDGVEWTRTDTVCIDFEDEREYAISRPCVVRDGDTYRMWFSSRGDAYRMRYAESADGIAWQRRDDVPLLAPSESGWDSEMVAYPYVFDHAGSRWLLYNGNGYGRTGIGCATLQANP